MAVKKRCFVISPIGEEGSEIRKAADGVLEYIIIPALDKYDFDIVRSDRITKSVSITAEIIELVQSAELCIIDLTGHNPNVFYEAGRRHETGRPFVQLIQKGQNIPFDVAGIQTIFYEIDTPRSVLDGQQKLKSFIDEYQKEGFTTPRGVSLATIASSIDRLERRIEQAITGQSGQLRDQSGGGTYDFDMMKHPTQIFMEAMAVGDIERAASALPRLRGLEPQAFIASAGMLAARGSDQGFREILNTLDHANEMPVETFGAAIASIVQYYSITNAEDDGLERVQSLINVYLETHTIDDKSKASLLNQLQRITYGAEKYDDALELILEVVRLDGDEASYYYNASGIYESLDQPKRAIAMMEKCLAIDGGADDPDHLFRAVKLFAENGMAEKAKSLFAKLEKIDRAKAAILMQFDQDVRSALGL